MRMGLLDSIFGMAQDFLDTSLKEREKQLRDYARQHPEMREEIEKKRAQLYEAHSKLSEFSSAAYELADNIRYHATTTAEQREEDRLIRMYISGFREHDPVRVKEAATALHERFNYTGDDLNALMHRR